MSEDIITEGRNAWCRIRARERTGFEDWVAVGKACAVGRRESLAKAKTNKPYGKTYNKHMGAFLRAAGLDEVHNQERYWALQIIDNLAEIERWREGLDARAKRAWSHPQSIWAHWRKSHGTEHHAEHRKALSLVAGKKGSRIFFDQDMIRRAAAAMRESRSNDLFILARVALEAAIPDVETLALLIPDRPAKPARDIHVAT